MDFWFVSNVYIFLVCFVETGTSTVFSYTLVDTLFNARNTKPWEDFWTSASSLRSIFMRRLAKEGWDENSGTFDITKRCHNFGCQWLWSSRLFWTILRFWFPKKGKQLVGFHCLSLFQNIMHKCQTSTVFRCENGKVSHRMEGAWGSHPLPGKSFLNYFEAAVLGVDHGDWSPGLVNQPPPDLNPRPK